MNELTKSCKSKLKIAIFTDSFLPGCGGTENAVHCFAKEMNKFCEVKVFAPDYHKDCSINTDYEVVRLKSIRATENDYCIIPKLFKKTREELDDFVPDIIHVQTLGLGARIAAKYAMQKDIPIVYTVHTKYSYCYKHSLKSALLAKFVMKVLSSPLKSADRIFTVSSSMLDEIRGYGINKQVSVIKNGMAEGLNVSEKQKNQKFTMLFVGMLIKYKNLDFSLKVLKELKNRGRDFEFRLIGEGHDRKRFEKIVKKEGLSDNVRFLGRITDRESLASHYSLADLFLFPSIFDNDPLVVCEAGLRLLPSFVIENTGASERIIDGISGFTAKNDVCAFADKIEYLMDNPEFLKIVGKNSAKLATPWKENAKAYLSAYKGMIAEKETNKTIQYNKKEKRNGNLRRTFKTRTYRSGYGRE